MKLNRIITLLLILTLLAIIMEAESRITSVYRFVSEKVSIEDSVAHQASTSTKQKSVSLFYNN